MNEPMCVQTSTGHMDASHKLTVTIRNAARHSPYGPQDAFTGTVHYSNAEELPAGSVVVSFGAICTIDEYDEDGTQIAHQERSITQKDLVVHHNPDPNPAKTTSTWGFACRFANMNRHLPSFYYRSPDWRRCAKIEYVVTATVKSDGLPDGVLECRQTIDYWPSREQEIVPGDIGTRADQMLTVTTSRTDARPSWKRRPQMLRLKKALRLIKTEKMLVTVVLEAPRFVVFEKDLDIKVALRHAGLSGRRDGNFYLDHVDYRLFAITRIGGRESPQNRELVQQQRSLPLRTTRLSYVVSSLSRNHTAMKIVPHVADIVLDNGARTTITPTFGSPYIFREYSLDVDIYIAYQDETYRARFENVELILLPPDIHHSSIP